MGPEAETGKGAEMGMVSGAEAGEGRVAETEMGSEDDTGIETVEDTGLARGEELGTGTGEEAGPVLKSPHKTIRQTSWRTGCYPSPATASTMALPACVTANWFILLTITLSIWGGSVYRYIHTPYIFHSKYI